MKPNIISRQDSHFRFGLKKRIYNWNMRIAREAKGWRQKDLAIAIGVSTQTISHIETLRAFPEPERAELLSDALGISIEALFPEWLKEFKILRVPPSTQEENISLEEAMAQHLLKPTDPELLVAGWEEDIEHKVDMELLGAKFEEICSSLTPREQRVIQLRFGFGGQRSRTLEEVSSEFKVNRERIRQIEAKALRKLRHPTNRRNLEDYC